MISKMIRDEVLSLIQQVSVSVNSNIRKFFTFLKGVMPQGLSSCSGSPVIISLPAGSDWIRTWEPKQIDVDDSVYEFTKKRHLSNKTVYLRLEPVSM